MKNIKTKKAIRRSYKTKRNESSTGYKKPQHLSSSEARIKGAKTYYSNKQKKLRKTVKSLETRLDKLNMVEKTKELPPY